MSGVTSIECRPLIQNNYSMQSSKAVNFRGSEDIEDLLDSYEETEKEDLIDSFDDSKKSDKPKDRGFDINNALANFGKGFISPVTTMFSSATNFVIGAGTMGICAGAMKATQNKLGPVLVVAGTLYGVLQTALGIKKVVKAENNKEREKAFFDVGSGTAVVTLSVVAAKTALELAELAPVEAEPLTITKSTVECFKNAPTAFSDSISVLNDNAVVSKVLNGIGNKEVAAVAGETIEGGNIARIFAKSEYPMAASVEESRIEE